MERLYILKDIAKEELETMIYDKIAYLILEESGEKMKLLDLFTKVCKVVPSRWGVGGIKTILISNGYTSQNTLNDLINCAVNIDVKNCEDKFNKEVCSGKIIPLLNSIKTYYENKIHTKVTTILIPDYNDD